MTVQSLERAQSAPVAYCPAGLTIFPFSNTASTGGSSSSSCPSTLAISGPTNIASTASLSIARPSALGSCSSYSASHIALVTSCCLRATSEAASHPCGSTHSR